MKYTHFLYCPFTGLGLYNGYRGDTWLNNRIKIFKQFILPSILNQTEQDFILWISWRSEEKENPIVQQFGESLAKIRDLSFVFTYGGLCFWDDKYDDETAYKRLKSSLDQTLPELSEVVEDSDYVYMTIQPSDDMYLSHVIETTQKFFEEYDQDVMGFSRGYIANYETKEVAEYDPTTLPPFYTVRFERETFLNPQLHMDFTGPYKSHEYVKDFIPSHYTPERGFIVGTHGENISTHWNHPFKGRTLSLEETEKVLMDTGNYFTEPLVVTKDAYRIWMKRLLNILPKFLQRKIITYLSSNKVEKQIKNYKWFNL